MPALADKLVRLRYLGELSLKEVFDNFYQVIEDHSVWEADCSSFSIENRLGMQSLKLLTMMIEIERYNDQEFQSKPEFKLVTLEDVSKRIDEFERDCDPESVKDVRFECKMRRKLESIQNKEKFDELFSKLKFSPP